ncbi:MAG: Zn-dependent hydrolase, partial [Acidobacteriales bacterium]|nr:Zn-dependent hydrolase [Terriglobales bacterium]
MKLRLSLVLTVLLLASVFAFAQAPPRHINPARLWSTLEKLSEFGRPVGADFDAGVTRVGFSDAELAAREYVMGLMRDAGLAVR